jgi:hypothetical protein
MHRAWPLLLLILAGIRLCAADKITIHGYVVEVNSPMNLTVDDFSVTNPSKLHLDFAGGPGSGSAALQPGEARVGTEIEITGEYDAATHQMKVTSVNVVPGTSNGPIKGTALLDKLPALEKTPGGWNGYIFADGRKVRVTDSSVLTLTTGNAPVDTLDGIDFDTFAHYEGTRQPDGSITASRVEFAPIQTDASEIKLLQKLATKLEDPAPAAPEPAKLLVGQNTFRLVQDQAAQNYIQRVGQSLIPAHQRNLADDNPLKVPFRFYLVADNSTDLTAYPNGVIVVPSAVLNLVENEAQLAFLLSDAITQVLERDVWRLQQSDKLGRTGLRLLTVADGVMPVFAVPVTGLFLASKENTAEDLVEQADRVGMERMLEAGYDVREAPRTWKALALKQPPLNPLANEGPDQANRDDEDNEWALRRGQLMTQLRENYPGVDYSALKKDSDEFHAIAERVPGAAKKKPRKP